MWRIALLFVFAIRLAGANCEQESAHTSELYFNKAEKIAWREFQLKKIPGEFWYRRGATFKMDRGETPKRAVERMLSQSRSYTRRAPVAPSPSQARIIAEEKFYFEKGYFALFGRKARYSMDKRTVLIDEPDESNLADGVRKKTYVYSREPEGKFSIIIAHELIHLYSPGFRLDEIEEAMVEYIRWRIHELSGRSEPFRFVSETYNLWRLGLVEVFAKLPQLEAAFLRSFKSRKLRPLYQSLRRERAALRKLLRTDSLTRPGSRMAEVLIHASNRP